ncbi:MAG: ribose 5-phosphate isomerase B [Deltaproteobacteria bacterium]|nr:MAG: ribose 5-phosphate isomerase B [Deltaproteobacteria bacterium]
MRIAIAADHAGVDVKDDLKRFLATLGHQTEDLGPQSRESVDYPDFAHHLAREVVEGKADRGVLICGSGIGMSIAANKVPGARAALVHDAYTARMARQHNDANILVLGARVLGPDLLKDCLHVFLNEDFTPGDDGRHLRRVQKLELHGER